MRSYRPTFCNHSNDAFCSDDCDLLDDEDFAILDAIADIPLDELETLDIALIADDLLESENTRELLIILKRENLLNSDQITQLAEMLEICPTHMIDYRICLDDAYPQIPPCQPENA